MAHEPSHAWHTKFVSTYDPSGHPWKHVCEPVRLSPGGHDVHWFAAGPLQRAHSGWHGAQMDWPETAVGYDPAGHVE